MLWAAARRLADRAREASRSLMDRFAARRAQAEAIEANIPPELLFSVGSDRRTTRIPHSNRAKRKVLRIPHGYPGAKLARRALAGSIGLRGRAS